MFGNIGKLFGKVDAVVKIAEGLGRDIGDVKATVAAIEADMADAKAVWAEIKGMMGHTPAPATVPPDHVIIPAALVPNLTAPATVLSVPSTAAPGLASQLGAVVSGVAAGIKDVIPGQGK